MSRSIQIMNVSGSCLMNFMQQSQTCLLIVLSKHWEELQAIDYALVKHAEGDWLSNFEGAAGEKTDIRIRNMAWWRSPAMPATALVIGNPQMQDQGWETHIKSIAGALPIMLGDPRKLSGERPEEISWTMPTGFSLWKQNTTL